MSCCVHQQDNVCFHSTSRYIWARSFLWMPGMDAWHGCRRPLCLGVLFSFLFRPNFVLLSLLVLGSVGAICPGSHLQWECLLVLIDMELLSRRNFDVFYLKTTSFPGLRLGETKAMPRPYSRQLGWGWGVPAPSSENAFPHP